MATFGKTAVGASSTFPTVNTRLGCIFQAPASGTITALNIYWESGDNGQHLRSVVYNASNASTPSSLVAAGSFVNTTGDTVRWETLPVSAAVVGLNFYVLGIWVQSVGASNQGGLHYDVGAAGSSHQATQTYGDATAAADPWGTDTTATNAWSIYATYTPTVVTPTQDVLGGLGPNVLDILSPRRHC